jgi:serine/threonine protein kinase
MFPLALCMSLLIAAELVDHPDYEIVRELGRGGMGVVYLARNKLMGRPEVLKVVGGQLVERPGVRDRFLREVQSAAKLQHRNIVAAYSATRLGESIVLAMEFIDGEDLAKMVKSRGPLPVVHACYFTYQAALGLQHAHERGMVHRDIKPANLIFALEGKKGVVKVLDFGLAKVTIEGQADSGLTREGQMLGTPDYIAPEQIRDAQSADIRADIYSLGCTLYYLLTGGPPFRGEHLWDLYQAHFSMDANPLNLVRPEVPVELAAVVAKMMAKEPGRRFQTPGDVAQALTPFLKKGNVASTGSKPEVSQAGRADTKQATAGAGSVSPQPVTSRTPVAVPPGKTLHEKASPQAAWESLVELKETERSPHVGAPAIAAPQRQRPRWIWPAVAAGVLLLGLVVAWAAGVFKVKTKDGVIVLENVPADALVEVDGERITVTPAVGNPIKIEAPAGKHEVAVKRGDDVILGKSVTVESGKPLKLMVRLEPPAAPEPGKTSPPPAAETSLGTATAVAKQGDEPIKPPAVPEAGRASSEAVETPPSERKDGQAQGTAVLAAKEVRATKGPRARAPMEEIVRLRMYGSPRIFVLSPDSKRVAVVQDHDHGCTLCYNELDTGKVLFGVGEPRPVIGDRPANFSSVIVAPDGDLITSHLDQMIRVWDKSDGKAVRNFEPLPLGANFGNLRCSKQGAWVVGATMLDEVHRDAEVRIWDYKSGEELKRYKQPSAVKSLDVHPEGKRIVSLHEDNVIRVWDALTGAIHVEFHAFTDRVGRVSYSPDGRQLLCLPQHPVVEFYLVGSENGKLIRTFKGPGTNVLDAAFFPSGLQVPSISAENILRVWSVDAGLVLYSKLFDKDVRTLGISPDGRYVVVTVPGETILYRWRG